MRRPFSVLVTCVKVCYNIFICILIWEVGKEMGALRNFWGQLDWWGILSLCLSAAAALLCITFHELSHGYTAYRLGDPTAKNAGRLTFNPIKHIDFFGLLMMLVAGVGWAKPVPVDMRYFKRPKQGMALTALAGPASNFLLALAAVLFSSLLYHLFGEAAGRSYVGAVVWLLTLSFLANVAILSVGLGLFNLIPISPLDGSKILLSFLPEKIYLTILRYERYIMIVVLGLTFFGAFSTPLSFLMNRCLQFFCSICGYSLDTLYLFAYLMNF